MIFSKIQTEIKWGIWFSIMMLTWMGMERSVGLHDVYISKHAIYTNLVFIPAFAIYILALLAKRKSTYNGKITYKQAFLSGLILTLVVTILSPLTQFITSVVISPQYFSHAISHAIEQGAMTPEQAESFFTLGNYLLLTATSTPIFGVVITAIASLFVRNTK